MEIKIRKVKNSSDGTIKLQFDGYHAVLIPSKKGYTLCISSQVGCAMGCSFCYTAKMGFKRNLSAQEIMGQFTSALEHLGVVAYTRGGDVRLRRAHTIISALVFMGMGEPLNNYSAVMDAIRLLNEVYEFPFKKITVSTVGIVHQMNKFVDYEHPVHLALSLHSAIQEKRDRLMPLVKRISLLDLVAVVNAYNATHKHKMMIEYIMIGGLNDTKEDLDALLSLNFSAMTNFNLIPLNGNFVFEGKQYGPSDVSTQKEFKRILRERGFKCFIRRNKGNDIDAACGMLA